jgi:hypothetical protein
VTAASQTVDPTWNTLPLAIPALLCPLRRQRFRDPVVAADGVAYERDAIEGYFAHRPPRHSPACFGQATITSPVTGRPMPNRRLVTGRPMPNRRLLPAFTLLRVMDELLPIERALGAALAKSRQILAVAGHPAGTAEQQSSECLDWRHGGAPCAMGRYCITHLLRGG